MKILITGVTGQDGSYLKTQLAPHHNVYGLVRPTSPSRTVNIKKTAITLVDGDITDDNFMESLICCEKFDIIFNTAAQTFVKSSFSSPDITMRTNAGAVKNMLEAIKGHSPSTRFLQFSTSEMFGAAPAPQNELTSFHPRSPYGISKCTAYWWVRHYREAYGIHASNAIFFNHESPLRPKRFVTKKIISGCVDIENGLKSHIELGNLDAKRDWGYAPEYMKFARRIIMHNEPLDIIVGTGQSHSVKEFLSIVLDKCALSSDVVKINKSFMRPADVPHLQADTSKLKRVFGEVPSVALPKLIDIMLEAERW